MRHYLRNLVYCLKIWWFMKDCDEKDAPACVIISVGNDMTKSTTKDMSEYLNHLSELMED